jgi:hypothetical protein
VRLLHRPCKSRALLHKSRWNLPARCILPRCSSLSPTKSIGRGCAATTLSCLIDLITHESFTGSPPILTSSVDPGLLSPPTRTLVPPSVFYSQSTRNCPVTPPPNASIDSIATSTPISNKTSGNHSHASGTHDGDSSNYRLAQETSCLFLGAMPPQ